MVNSCENEARSDLFRWFLSFKNQLQTHRFTSLQTPRYQRTESPLTSNARSESPLLPVGRTRCPWTRSSPVIAGARRTRPGRRLRRPELRGVSKWLRGTIGGTSGEEVVRVHQFGEFWADMFGAHPTEFSKTRLRSSRMGNVWSDEGRCRSRSTARWARWWTS